MAVQQFRQEVLMDGHFAAIERRQFLLVVVHNNDFVTQVGKARPGDQPHVSRPDHGYLHWPPSSTRKAIPIDRLQKAYFSSFIAIRK